MKTPELPRHRHLIKQRFHRNGVSIVVTYTVYGQWRVSIYTRGGDWVSHLVCRVIGDSLSFIYSRGLFADVEYVWSRAGWIGERRGDLSLMEDRVCKYIIGMNEIVDELGV